MVEVIKVVNKKGSDGKRQVEWQEVTLASGAKVACVEGKLMSSSQAVQILSMPDSTYSYTCIANRVGTQLDFTGVHFPNRR